MSCRRRRWNNHCPLKVTGTGTAAGGTTAFGGDLGGEIVGGDSEIEAGCSCSQVVEFEIVAGEEVEDSEEVMENSDMRLK